MLEMTKCIRHRGPDWSGCVVTQEEGTQGSILCHERLAIVGVDTGAQPLVSTDGKLILAVNGEIYNHRILRKGLKDQDAQFKTHSDCEVILHLYREHGADFVHLLDGMFSFILLDTSVTPTRVIAARDPIGITTFYQGWASKYPGALYFSSELKSLNGECDTLRSFPPGHYYDSARAEGDETVRYYTPSWLDGDQKDVARPTGDADLTAIREALERAVRKRLMSEVPYGVLLSGGLDSSLIAAIAARETNKVAEAQRQRYEQRKASRAKAAQSNGVESPAAAPAGMEEDEAETLAAWPRLHSFSIGLEGSPDLIAARSAANYLGTAHHEHTFTVQEGLDAISDVIYHLETFDVTTVRASTPMYLLSRKIKAMGVKMVLSGEGSDEIFGGYLYFHAAPNADDFHSETVQRIKNLHMADCLRANKSTMAWGLEARVPFLDKAFLDVSVNIDAQHKMFSKGSLQSKDAEGRPHMEKYILRKAFDLVPEGDEKPYLPESILWRQKEQFSDGVGSSWIDSMKAEGEKCVSDEQFAKRAERFPVMTPDTKEAYWLREIFDRHFPDGAAATTVQRWVPKAEWGCNADPSGRAQSIHNAYKEGEFASAQQQQQQ
ncbi:unnamed protein product [Parajaminaea phylloscopi]